MDIIREVRPRVVISYDDNGFYGHPDHIQAHRVAWRAVQLAADSCPVAKLYATALPRSVLAGAIRLSGPRPARTAGPAPPPGFTEVAAVDGPALRRPGRAGDNRDRCHPLPGGQGRGHARARHPDRGARAVLCPVQRRRPAHPGPGVTLHAAWLARRASQARPGGRPDLFAGLHDAYV